MGLAGGQPWYFMYIYAGGVVLLVFLFAVIVCCDCLCKIKRKKDNKVGPIEKEVTKSPWTRNHLQIEQETIDKT